MTATEPERLTSLTRALRAPVHAVVVGPPGSGKTYLATTLARTMADAAHVVLLVANEHVAGAIRERLGDGTGILVDTWRQRLRKIHEGTKPPESPFGTGASEPFDVHRVLRELTPDRLRGPDAVHDRVQVVVDEAQDVPAALFRALGAHGVPVLALMDPVQRSAAEGASLEDVVQTLAVEDPWPVFALEEDFRTTAPIQRFAATAWAAARAYPARPSRRSGPAPDVIEGDLEAIAERVRAAREAPDVASVVVAVANRDRGRARRILEDAGWTVAAPGGGQSDAVHLLPFEGLRGLEYDAVVHVVPNGPIEEAKERRAFFADQYVAATRARRRLSVVVRPDVDDDARKALRRATSALEGIA